MGERKEPRGVKSMPDEGVKQVLDMRDEFNAE